jgi:DNA end-binding protein Ku
MSARASASGAITFGLVRVPVKMFTANSNETVSFKMITPEGNPIKQKNFDPVSLKEYTYNDCSKGYEVEKDTYVLFTKEELQSLDADPAGKGNIEVDSFVPEESVDFVHVEKSYYLKPDKGGDAAFKLLSQAMLRNGLCVVGIWTSRGKEQLVQVRPYKGGMILHTLYYSNEVRDYDDNCATVNISGVEEMMADKLIQGMTKPAFDPKKYRDQYTDRVMAAVESKRSGKTVTAVVPNKPASLGLFDALKASLGQCSTTATPETKEPEKPKKRRSRKKTTKA